MNPLNNVQIDQGAFQESKLKDLDSGTYFVLVTADGIGESVCQKVETNCFDAALSFGICRQHVPLSSKATILCIKPDSGQLVRFGENTLVVPCSSNLSVVRLETP